MRRSYNEKNFLPMTKHENVKKPIALSLFLLSHSFQMYFSLSHSIIISFSVFQLLMWVANRSYVLTRHPSIHHCHFSIWNVCLLLMAKEWCNSSEYLITMENSEYSIFTEWCTHLSFFADLHYHMNLGHVIQSLAIWFSLEFQNSFSSKSRYSSWDY